MKKACAIALVLLACANASRGGSHLIFLSGAGTNSARAFPDLTNTIFVGRGSSNILLAYYLSTKPPTRLDPAKALCLTNGITFKGIVDTLGPGWKQYGDGMSLVYWRFTDGRTVSVWLPHYVRSNLPPLTTNSFLWHTNWPGEFEDPKHRPPKPRYIVW